MKGLIPPPRAVRFGPYRLDLRSRELSRPGRTVRLPEKPFLVLAALVESPSEVVTREELRERLWPGGIHVDFDNNLNSAVATLRAALRDSARRPRFVETLPRVGYRFLAGVTPEGREGEAGAAHQLPAGPLGTAGPGSAPPGTAPSPAARGVSRGRLAVGAVALSTVMVAGLALWATMSPEPHAGATAKGGAAGPGSGPGLPEDPAARRAWLRARYLGQREEAAGLERALESYTEVALNEPAFAPAHAGRAEVLSRLAFMPGREMASDLEEARQAARRALDLDGSQAPAHRVLAVAALHLDWDMASARREILEALALDPGDDRSHMAAALLHAAAGRHGRAIAAARRAVELDPASNLIRADLGFFYLAAGRYEESIRACREALELEPGFRPALQFLVEAGEGLGRHAEAAGAARELLRQEGALDEGMVELASASPRRFLEAFRLRHLRRMEAAYAEDPGAALWLALAHAELDHREEALRYLGEAFDARNGWLIFAGSFPQLRSLHGDPEFDRLLERVGIPPGPRGPAPA